MIRVYKNIRNEPTMSTHKRQAIVSLLTTLLLAMFFAAYVLPRYPAGNPYTPEVFHFWGLAFVVLVPVSIVANIAVTMVFSMVYAMATGKNPRPSPMNGTSS